MASLQSYRKIPDGTLVGSRDGLAVGSADGKPIQSLGQRYDTINQRIESDIDLTGR